jgi:ABC-2 type transport system ATP-binding protein
MPAGVTGQVPALEWSGVTKRYARGERTDRGCALAGWTWQVESGRIAGLLGPNGGGKSTALKLMLGLIAPTEGTCRIFGRCGADPAARQEVGYVPDSPQFHPSLTGFEVIDLAAELCGCPARERTARVNAWLDRVGLAAAAHRRLGTYSRGMLQRVGLAQALVHEPRVLILDEPTAGVDAKGVELIHRLLLELKRDGRAILLTSHLLSDLADLCDDIAIVVEGRLVAAGSVADLTGSEAFAVESLPAGGEAGLQEWVTERGGVVRRLGRGVQLQRTYLAALGES